jgi:serine/threonine protein kinase
LAEASFLWCTVRPAAVTADPLRSSGFRCVYGVLLCGRGSPTHPNPLDRQVFDMGSNERDECMNEIRLLQSMDHPHIIDYLSCVIEHNELTVVMELVPASIAPPTRATADVAAGASPSFLTHSSPQAAHGDMAGLIKTAAKAAQPLTEAVVWRHFSQIADALAYMHEKRVMHRDIKPANVFVTETNHVKLGDLGVGRHFSSKTDMVHSTVGTPYYMSPECIQGKTGYDFKSDLWSLGCLLYEMAKLRTPFYSEKVNFYVLGKRITSCQYDPVGDGYSPQLAGLVGKMLQSNPADRPSATEVFQIAGEARLEFPEQADGGAPSE